MKEHSILEKSYSSCPKLQSEEVKKNWSSRIFYLRSCSYPPSVTALDNTYGYMTESSRRDVALWITRNLQILKGNSGKAHIPATRFLQGSRGSAGRLPGCTKQQKASTRGLFNWRNVVFPRLPHTRMPCWSLMAVPRHVWDISDILTWSKDPHFSLFSLCYLLHIDFTFSRYKFPFHLKNYKSHIVQHPISSASQEQMDR